METESQSCLRRIFPIVGEKWLLVSEVPKHSNLTKNRHIFSLLAPKDGLEHPTTGEDTVESFAEDDVAISNYDESEEFVTSRCRFGLRGFHFRRLEFSHF